MAGIWRGRVEVIASSKHPQKPGLVTIARNASVDLPRGTLNSILKQAGLKI
jgi:predicted RNA binding protein YcfA (HicA-like mRNA interferase family)